MLLATIWKILSRCWMAVRRSLNEVKQADEALRKYLMSRFAALLRDKKFVTALPGHLPGDTARQARAPLVMERIAEIVKSG